MMLTYPYTIENPVTSTFSLAKLSPNRPYLLWWYAALVKGSESGQNNLQVLFREILDRTDTGLELGKIVKEILPLPLLGQYRIGSIWINGKFVEEVHYPVVEFKVSFTEGCWRYKTFNAQSKLGKQNDPFPLDLYPLLCGANDFSRLIEFDLDNGGKLVLNGMDFFRAAYGHSPELKRILTSYPYQIKPPSQGDSILSLLLPPFPSHLKPSGNLDVLQPSHKFVKQDAVFLAHLKRDAHTKQVVHEFANNCFKSFFNQSKKGSIPFVFLAPEPWHTHPDVTIRVRGIPFDNQSFLGLNILAISDPPGLKIAGNTRTTPPVVGAFVMRLILPDDKQLVCIELIGRNGKGDFTGLMAEVDESASTLLRWINWILRETVKHAGVFNKFIKKSLYTHYKVYKHGEEGRNTVERVMRELFS